MSADKIAEIRARHAQSEKNYIELESTWKAQVHEDRDFLLTEVEKLTREHDEARISGGKNKDLMQSALEHRVLEVEALIVALSVMHRKLRDQFFRAEPIRLIDMVEREIARILEASPTYRRSRAVLHARRPDPNEEDL